ncbi:MAG: hypothetical protein IT372_24970 [Polyangiaceae bacterium]|nr:hypothetical protein [Polyangiaceae bacterium]
MSNTARTAWLWCALALAAPAGCGAGHGPLTCGQIPEGGCPIGRGGTCDDAVCAGLYDCVEGAWTLVTRCEQGGGGGAGGQAAGAGGGGAGGCEEVSIDHAGEITGCAPDLQSPDCPAAAAETCASTACLTGCLDFFLCTAEGWTEVAYCADDGQLVVTQ